MSVEPPTRLTFRELGLPKNLCKLLRRVCIEYPTSVQETVLQQLALGGNAIVQSERCTGKITALCLAVVMRISRGKCEPFQAQAVIAVPTWELAREVSWLLRTFVEFKRIKCNEPNELGTDIFDTEKVRTGVHVFVATPELIEQLMRENQLFMGLVDVFGIVEAQILLKDESKDKIESFITGLPSDAQLISISTALPDDVFETAKKLIPISLCVMGFRDDTETLERIKHYYLNTKDKLEIFRLMCKHMIKVPDKMIVFCNAKRNVDIVKEIAEKEGISVAAMDSGTVKQWQKIQLKQFLDNGCQLLVTTDMYPRCFVRIQVPVVVNYDVPTRFKDYLRRSCHAADYFDIITLVNDEETPQLMEIKEFYNLQWIKNHRLFYPES